MSYMRTVQKHLRYSTLCRMIGIFFLAVVFVPRSAAAQLTEIFQENLKGSVIMTGNTMGRSGQNAVADGPGTWGSVRAWINDRNPGAPTRDGGTWGDFTTGDWTENYSWAELDLAAVGGTSVVAVYLLWAGSCQRDDIANAANDEDIEPFITDAVTFEYPTNAGTSVISVTPDSVDNQCANAVGKLNSYVAWADVTDLGPDWRDGMYAVGGVPGTQNYHSNNYAGWTLIVVHENGGPKLHQITLWAGLRIDYNSLAAPPTEVSGFCYPGAGAAEPSRLLVTGIEGDSQFAEDSFRVGNTAVLTAADAISGDGHPLNNFFSSQITDRFGNYIDGSMNWTQADHVLTADPDGVGTTSGARQGWDIADVEISAGTFMAGDESAWLLPFSVGDSYALVAMAFDLTTDSANFEIQASTAYAPPTVYADATTGATEDVTFIVEIQNTGEHAADDVVFTHPLPANASAVGSFFYKLDSAAAVSLSPSMAALTGTGVSIPVSVPPDSFLRVGYTVTIADHLPDNPIQEDARFSYTWMACSNQYSGVVLSAPMTIDVEFCGDGIVSPGEDVACDGVGVLCIGDTVSGDTDLDGICDDLEATLKTDPDDADSDNDGVSDGDEPDFDVDSDSDGQINALDFDSDNDGIQDGTEMGLTVADVSADTDLTVFVPDADPGTTTNPLLEDTDGGGVVDGSEDTNFNGAVDTGETDPLDPSDDNPSIDTDTDSGGDGDTDTDSDADTDSDTSMDSDSDSSAGDVPVVAWSASGSGALFSCDTAAAGAVATDGNLLQLLMNLL